MVLFKYCASVDVAVEAEVAEVEAEVGAVESGEISGESCGDGQN